MGFWDAAQQGGNVGQMLNNNLYPDGSPLQQQALQQQNDARAQALALGGIRLNQQDLAYQDMMGARNLANLAGQQPPAAAVQLASAVAPAQAPSAPLTSNAAALVAPPAQVPTQMQSDISGLQANVNQYPGLAALSGSDQRLSDMKSAASATPEDIAGLQAMVDQYPGMAALSGADQRLADMKAALAQAQPTTAQPGAAATQAAADPAQAPATAVDAQAQAAPAPAPTDGYMEHLKQLRDYWTGKDDAKAAEFNTQYQAAAQQRGQMAAFGVTDPADLATIQAKMAITASHADLLEKGMKLVVDAYDKSGATGVNAIAPVIQQLPGMDKFDPSKIAVDPSARFVSTLLPDGSSLIFDNDHPKDWKLEPASELSTFRQGYFQKNPGASLSDMSQAFQQFQLQKYAAQRSMNVINAVPRETMIGVDASGNAVYKDSHGGPPFQYSGGKQVTYNGPVLGKGEAMNLGGNTPDPVTGLTPVQMKANAKALQDPTNIRTVQLINGVAPVGQRFMQAISALPDDAPVAAVTNVLRSAGVQLNNRQINDFQTFATEFPREAQRAMVGSGQTAQKSLDQQADLFSKAKTVGNLKSSLGIVLGILQDRKAGVMAPVYPPAGYQPPASGGAPGAQQGKPLDAATAQQFLLQSGGDKNAARNLARKAGYQF